MRNVIIPCLLAIGFSSVASSTLTGCGDSAILNRGVAIPGASCSPVGEEVEASNCGALACGAGFTAGRRCEATGRWSTACVCVRRESDDADAGNVDSGTTGNETLNGSCSVNGRVRQVAGGSGCSATQVFVATCVNGRWSDGRCEEALGGPSRWCVPTSVTTTVPACASCSSGQVASRRCDTDGRGYGDCFCSSVVTDGGTTGCANGASQGCSITCSSGQVNGTQTCNSGIWGTCSASCPNTQTCTPGAMRVGGTCNPCSGGATGNGAYYCNSAGNGEECRLTPGSACTGGGGGGGACGGGSINATARNANNVVRCWGNNVVWTSTTNEFRAGEATLAGNQCGYARCRDGVMQNGIFVADQFYRNTANIGRPASDRFTRFGVSERGNALQDTLSGTVARPDPYSTEIAFPFPVNENCINRNGDC